MEISGNPATFDDTASATIFSQLEANGIVLVNNPEGFDFVYPLPE